MNTSCYIISVFVLAFVISVVIGYLLLYRGKIGRDSRDEESETQEGKSTEEEISYKTVEEKAEEVEEVSTSSDGEKLITPPEEEKRRQTEEEAKCKAEEDARWQAEEEVRREIEEDARRKAEEDALRQVDEEAQRKAVEESLRREEEEARRKAEEEVQRQTEEEIRRKAEEEVMRQAEEEAKRRVEEEAQRKVDEGLQQQVESTIQTRAPEDRGGKPRELSNKDENGYVKKIEALAKAVKEKALSLRPEVVCWKDARKWFIGLEIQEEYQEFGGIVVTQDGVLIQKDGRGRWVLLKTTGIVQVRWEEIGYQKEIRLDKPYRVFRLSGMNQGRSVRYATFGYYRVIVPDDWQRDERISGPDIQSTEPVCITGFQAHYFLLERGSDSKICFRTSTGEPITVPTRASRFELIGNQLSSDASDDIGPLFAERPPRIKASDQNIWKGIKTIVVGQEGSGRKRWRTHFAPNPDNIEQIFPDELHNRRGGWYFLRFYDLEDTLVESMDFRFVSALKEIVVHPHSPLPGLDGHSSVPIEFVHTSGCAIRLAEGSDESLQVQRTEDKTVAVIPPNPVWDRTRWSIEIDSRLHTDAVILVERVWWAVGDEDVAKVQPHWSEKPIIAPREAFSATSKQVLWLRLPKERWIDTLLVGFAKYSSRIYKVEVTKKHVAIPLSDFAGYQELEDKFLGHSLSLWIEAKGQDSQATVITILPDKPLPQVSERPLSDTRTIPEDKPTSHIPKAPDYSDTPVDCKCCSTCDFAIFFHRQGIRCTVGTWEEMVDWDTFYFQFATHICFRWQGEYRGPDGTMISG
ncbi:MAG: hypothetical protein KJ606_05565 [Chloroflexi bacterium]|nr:hypothetical protein [Chloroflexota bacterium]